MNKILFDGTLLAENEMMGNNNAGLCRVAEEVIEALITEGDIELYFANFYYMQNYHTNLFNYINRRYPNLTNHLISKKPAPFFEPLKFKAIWYKYPQLMFMPVNNGSFDKYDLFHSFYYPFKKEIRSSKIKKCITYHDIIPLKTNSPKSIENLTKNIVKDIENNYAIAVSEFSKNDLLNYNNNIDPENIFVAHNAASSLTFFKNKAADEWERVKEKYKLPQQYFFCITSNDPRKNIAHVVKSFDKFLQQEKRNDIYLLLAGNSAHGRQIVNNVQVSKKTIDRIITPSRFIDEEDLSIVYSNALCFIFMSLYEGFGLPVLEAMQCGTPTISANNSSLPEVVGDAGILLSPNDEDALAEKMLLIYNDESLRNKISELGLDRSKTFSWQKTALEYNRVFDNIING